MTDRAPSVDDPPGLAMGPLTEYLSAQAPGLLRGPATASLLAGGRSNLTYLLTDGDRRWVLRRPPLGVALETAHDMGREYRMLEALHTSPVPVPRPVHLAGDAGTRAVGAPFYIMGFAEGAVPRAVEDLRAVSDPRALGRRLMSCLADLHAIDPGSVGLGDLGRPDGYLSRQIERWLRQVAAGGSDRLAHFEDLATRLRQDQPETQRTTLVHGDYRLDNVVIDPAGRIEAVLDWEMATRGDPLADVASTLVWWDGMTGLDSPVAAHPGDVAGFPGRERLLRSYGESSELDLGSLDWYLGFAFFKIAAIFEGIRRRDDAGLTVGSGFERLGPLVPPLLERARDSLR